MENFDLSEEMQKLVEKQGDRVGFQTPHCVLWKAEHENCRGCECELGCGKTIRLMMLMLIPGMYQSRDYDDYRKMNNRIQELMDKTLSAKTVSELDSIPTQ